MEWTTQVYLAVISRGENETEGGEEVYVKVRPRWAAHIFP